MNNCGKLIAEDVKAKWIWSIAQDSEGYKTPNQYSRFRKTMQLSDTPKNLTVRITADSRFKLWINGKFAVRGPARSEPSTQAILEFEIGPYLKEGANTVAALVYFIGESTAWYVPGRPGFLLDCPANPNFNTNSSWQALGADDYKHEGSVRLLEQLAFNEVWDASHYPEGWESNADGKGWKPAYEVGAYPCDPWTSLVLQEIPPPRETYIEAAGARDIYIWEQVPTQESTEIGELIRQRRRYPLPAGRCEINYPDDDERGVPPSQLDLRTRLIPDEGIRLTDNQSVVIDMGEIVAGHPRLEFTSTLGAIIELAYSEKLQGDGGGVPANYNLADRIIARDGRQVFETFEKRGLRYITLDVSGGEVTVHKAGTVFSSYPVSWHLFRTSDVRLNEIRRLSAYTVQLNMEDAYTDCQWRERGQWLGDARVEMLENYYTFGDYALARRLLFQVARSMDETGKAHAFVPTRNPCYIATWSLCYALMARDYYLYSGDSDTIRQVFEPVVRSVRHFDEWRKSGLLRNLPDWSFIDWTPVDVREASSAINAFYYGAITASAELAEALEELDTLKILKAMSEETREAFNREFWDEERGVYVDAAFNGKQSPMTGQPANCCAIHFGLTDENRANRVLDTVMNPHRQMRPAHFEHGWLFDPEKLRPYIVPAGSPYMSFYVLAALRACGRHAEALAYIRKYWGEMLEDGETATREMWVEFRASISSKAHGWSGAPAYDLPAFALGVRPIQPGWKEVTIEPNLTGLEWIEADIPTPLGSIRLIIENGRMQGEIPPGIIAKVMPSGESVVGVFSIRDYVCR